MPSRSDAHRGDPRPWSLAPRDLVSGSRALLRLTSPLLPSFTSARWGAKGLELRPLVPVPRPLEPLRPGTPIPFLARLTGLLAFLRWAGLGVAEEDVEALGASPRDPARPWLAAPPVPAWRAASPSLVVAATAVRLSGRTLPAGGSLRRRVESSLLDAEVLAGPERTALAAEDAGRAPESLLVDLAAGVRDLGPDLLGLAFPSLEADAPGESIVSAGPAALFLARSLARSEPWEEFVEVPAAESLENGAGLRRVVAALREDPRAALFRYPSEAVSTPSSGIAPLALVLHETDRWDAVSRARLAEPLDPALRLRLVETRSRPPLPWERRHLLARVFTRDDVARCVFLPLPALPAQVAMWEAIARASGGDVARALVAARRAADTFAPGRPSREICRGALKRRDARLQAAALLAARSTAAEVAIAAGVPPEDAEAAVKRAYEEGILVSRDAVDAAGPAVYAFRIPTERRELALGTPPRARRDAVARLEAAGLDRDRIAVAGLARAAPGDLEEAARALRRAADRDDREAALELLERAPASAPDLGAPLLALRLVTEAGRYAEARSLADGLDLVALGQEPLAARSSAARCLALVDRAAAALGLFPASELPAEKLARAEALLRARREGEAAELLDGLPASLPADLDVRRLLLVALLLECRGDREGVAEALAELARHDLARDPALEVELATRAGFLASNLGRRAEALAYFGRARDASRDDASRAAAAVDLAVTYHHDGQHAQAEREVSAALALLEALGDERRYVHALGNRAEILAAAGSWEAARRDLASVRDFDAAPGRERDFLYSVTLSQRLALQDGDDASARRAYEEALEREPAAPDHPSLREIRILEARRRLMTNRPAAAKELLDIAGRSPDDRHGTEPARRRLLVSAELDLGASVEGAEGLDVEERQLLLLEVALRSGLGPPPETLERLRGRLATAAEGASMVRPGGPGDGASGAAEVTLRLLEWKGRFPAAFEGARGEALRSLGREAARRAALPRALSRFRTPDPPAQTAIGTPPASRESPDRIAGEGAAMVAEDESTRAILAKLEKVAAAALPILVLGETGTGKELIAREVHRLSRRKGKLRAVNVAALSGTLIESELFGHVRGAFTGADRDREGLVESSSGGTLFLDEIGDLTLGLQAKLLRVLQEHEVVRVGETRARKVDLRVVAATHRDLRAMVDRGEFRADLYHRLRGHVVELAPLRERPADLAALLALSLEGTPVEEEARRALMTYAWPGNVRELKATVEAARALAGDGPIDRSHLPASLVHAAGTEPGARTPSLRAQLQEARRKAVLGALQASAGNRTRAARRLEISRQRLVSMLRELGLE